MLQQITNIDINTEDFYKNNEAFEFAYTKIMEAAKSSSQSIMWVCVAIAILIVIYKFYKVYQNASKDSEKLGVKLIYNMGQMYIGMIILIALSPVLINMCEQGLAEVTSDFSSQYKSSVNQDIALTVMEWKQQDDASVEKIKGSNFVTGEIARTMQRIANWFDRTLGSLALYITRGIFFLFLSGRYVWLIILQFCMPFAIVLSYEKQTREQYTFPFLKNLLCCYLLVPAFLIANNFAELVVDALFTQKTTITFDYRDLDSVKQAAAEYASKFPRWITMWISLIFKFYLYGKSAQYVKMIF